MYSSRSSPTTIVFYDNFGFVIKPNPQSQLYQQLKYRARPLHPGETAASYYLSFGLQSAGQSATQGKTEPQTSSAATETKTTEAKQTPASASTSTDSKTTTTATPITQPSFDSFAEQEKYRLELIDRQLSSSPLPHIIAFDLHVLDVVTCSVRTVPIALPCHTNVSFLQTYRVRAC